MGAQVDVEVVRARAAWSRVVEPGDLVAGGLLDAVGPVPALQWLRALDPDPDSIARGVGRLCEHLGVASPAARRRLERGAARWVPRLVGIDPHRELTVLARMGGQILVPEGPGWPQQMGDLGDAAPVCLWVRGEGDLAALLGRAVSLVGARASTDYGDRVAGELSAGLADHGFTTVSGGAYGIDAAVHRGSRAAGGPTVAFLAGGVDRLYPAGNADLLAALASGGGALVSEVPPGSVPSRSRFLKRNRLIAAAGSATVVVEAAWRSGSLATAGLAVELLRPVGAVPGPVTSMASAGCHRLLREGRAVCVTDTDEVRELAGGLAAEGRGVREEEERRDASARRPHDGLDATTLQVFDALPLRRPGGLEAIVRAAGVSAGEAMAAIGRLELLGLAERVGAGWRRGS